MTTTKVILTVGQAWSNSEVKECTSIFKVATEELRETSAVRQHSLHQLRDWLTKNPDVDNIRIDDKFLLRFLRFKKFSVPMAQQTLLKWLNYRKFYPQIAQCLDCNQDGKLAAMISNGYIGVSPVRDENGRRVIVYDIGKFNPTTYTWVDMARAHLIVYETLLEDEEDQILGFTHVGNAAGVTTSHITCWNPKNFGRLVKWGEQSLPMRHKEIHIVNVGQTIKYVIDFACSMASEKIASRVRLHTNLKSIKSTVGKGCLPANLGGVITNEEVIAHTQQLVNSRRAILLELDDMILHRADGIHSSRKCNAQKMVGSFRKLEID